jgi:hypothetical protein
MLLIHVHPMALRLEGGGVAAAALNAASLCSLPPSSCRHCWLRHVHPLSAGIPARDEDGCLRWDPTDCHSSFLPSPDLDPRLPARLSTRLPVPPPLLTEK